MASVIAPTTPLEPVASALRGDKPTGPNQQENVWQPEYINQDPDFAREAFDAMQPTGCGDTDMQNLPELYVQDGAMQEWATDLYDGAMAATKTGNLAQAIKLKKGADEMSSVDEELHSRERIIEDEQ